MIRTRKLPGSYSDDEIALIEAQARDANLEPTTFVRKRLNLPVVNLGRPLKPNKTNGSKRHKNKS